MGFRSVGRSYWGEFLKCLASFFKDKVFSIKELMENTEITEIKDIDVIEIYELWHYNKKNIENFRYVLLLI